MPVFGYPIICYSPRKDPNHKDEMTEIDSVPGTAKSKWEMVAKTII